MTLSPLRPSVGLANTMRFAVGSAMVLAVMSPVTLDLRAQAASGSARTDEPSVFDSDGDGVPEAYDLPGAARLAIELDAPVENLAQRTETLTSLVNPDGTVTLKEYGAPIRIQQQSYDPAIGGYGSAQWVPVDYSLTELPGGRWTPKASPADVVVNGVWNGQDEAARVEFDDGTAVALSWPAGSAGLDANGDGSLPTPTIDGPIATYALEGYSGSVDLVVGMTGSGVTALLRINERLTDDESALIEAAGVTFGIKTMGANTLSTSADAVAADPSLAPEIPGGGAENGLVVTNAEGALVGATPALEAWESSAIDDMGVPAETVVLDADLNLVGESGSGADRVVAHDLTVTPPSGFLTDSGTEYPIIIDPEIQSLTETQDTWVRNGANGTNGTDASLLVGATQAAPTSPAMSFVLFNGHSLTGQNIVDARLGLEQYYAGSCDSRSMFVHAVSGTWAESSTTWATQPGVHSSGYKTATVNRGYNCAAGQGRLEVGVTSIVQSWANSQTGAGTGFVNRGLRLAAPSGADRTYERRFCSMNYNSTLAAACVGKQPYLKVTYNSAPKQTAMPRLAENVGLETTDSSGPTLHVSTGRPTLFAHSIDDDGTAITHTFEARSSTSSSTNVSSCVAPPVFSGELASCKLNTALSNGGTYYLRTVAVDSLGGQATPSSWRRIKINNAVPTLQPVTCAGFANQQWYENPPAAQSTCSVTASNATNIRWEINGTLAAEAASVDANGSAIVSVPVPASGWTSVVATAISSAGLTSAPRTIGFGTGPAAALNEPAASTTSSTYIPVQATSVPGAISAQVLWRLAPSTANDTSGWAQATSVTVAEGGAPWDGELLPEQGGLIQTPRLLWDARTIPGLAVGAVAQVKVRFLYAGAVTRDTAPELVNPVPSSFGDGRPVQTVGPAAVALVTGETTIETVDAVLPEWDSIFVARTHLSRGAAQTGGPSSVFGPGWSAGFGGPDSGASQYSIVDRTAVDGSIQFRHFSGQTSSYYHQGGLRGAQRVGEYTSLEPAGVLGDSVQLAADTAEGGTHRITVALDGSLVDFRRMTVGGTAVWQLGSVRQDDGLTVVSYTYTPDGALARMTVQLENGAVCSTGTVVDGCAAYEFLYTTTGNTMAGTKRLTGVRLHTFYDDNGSERSTLRQVDIAKYSYNSTGLLESAWDPREGDGALAKKTVYTYAAPTSGSAGTPARITGIQEPDVFPWEIAYDSSGRVASITTSDPDGVPVVTSFEHDVPLTGAGLPQLDSASVTSMGQFDPVNQPINGTAVLVHNGSLMSRPVGNQWHTANLSYFNSTGQLTNASTNTDGNWGTTYYRYGAEGELIWIREPAGEPVVLPDEDITDISPDDEQLFADGSQAVSIYTEDPDGQRNYLILPNSNSVALRASGDTWWDAQCPGDKTTAYSDRHNVLKKYPRKGSHRRFTGGSKAFLSCGITADYYKNGSLKERQFGLRHIRTSKNGSHKRLFETYGYWYNGSSWGHFMNWSIGRAITHPAVKTVQSDIRFCYETKVYFDNYNGQRVTKWVRVPLGETGVRIITAFPTNNGGCTGASF